VSEFITGIFTFPTVFFSGLLVLVLFYWLTAVFGISSFETAEGDVAFDADLDASDGTFNIANLLSKFRLDGIPITISLSFIILASWVLSFLAVYFIYPVIPQGWIQISVGVWILLLAPVLAATIVSPLLQPLKPIFKKLPEKRAVDLVGQYVTVRSGKVNATFGEAVFQDGGAGLILKIRCPDENEIKRGDSVKLFSFDKVTHTYQITHK
jgi:hypothetical protein